ncbi:hypothetical protein BDV19DRAFT_357858 [Aspergillus venezuelensis]
MFAHGILTHTSQTLHALLPHVFLIHIVHQLLYLHQILRSNADKSNRRDVLTTTWPRRNGVIHRRLKQPIFSPKDNRHFDRPLYIEARQWLCWVRD